MNALVTGSSGFLGTALCRHLEHASVDLTRLNSRNCDLRDPRNLQQYSSDRFDLIFHLAAWTQAGDFCLTHPGEQWLVNQQINTNTLAWWAEHQPQAKFVFMGTSCAYAEDSDLTEDEYMVGEPIESLYTYAMTKRMLYQGARALNIQFGLNYLCAVPSTLYGPMYHTDGRQMHFIFDLIRKIIRGKELGEPVSLWGDGYQRRELVHVDDFADILWRLTEIADRTIVNVGAGEDHAIRDFASMICDIVGFASDRIEYDEARYVGARRKCLETSRLRTILPSHRLRGIEEGLRETIDWFYETKQYLGE